MDTLHPHGQNDNPSKVCSKCEQEYPATPEYFYRKKTGKYGLQPECKTCRSTRMQEYNSRSEVQEHKKAWSEEYWKNPDVRKRQSDLRKASRPPREHDSIPDGYKRCYVCKDVFLATTEYFHRHNGLKDGLRRDCKECALRQGQEYKHRSDVKERRKVYDKTRRSNPEFRERERIRYKAYRNQPEIRERYRVWQKERYYRLRGRILDQQKVRNSRPDVKSKRREFLSNWQTAYYSRPEIQESRRAHVRNRYARKKNASGTHTPQQIQEQYDRQKGKCYYCQKKVIWGKQHVDHVVPLSRGGSNDISNLVITCPTCNLSKNDKMPHEWPDGGRLL